MNFNAHPNLVLPPAFNRVSMLDGMTQAIKREVPFLIDGWLVEEDVTDLGAIDMILGILRVPKVLQHNVLIVPDRVAPNNVLWDDYREKGFAVFDEASPQKQGMGPELPFNHFQIRRDLLLKAAGQLSLR